jgi:hypothetical protein
MLSIPSKNSRNGWSVAEFEKYRPHLVSFIKKEIIPSVDNSISRRILIRAPVKSGKREIAEYIAKRDEAHNPSRVHAFISSFVRKADEDQRKEMKKHNLEVFPILTRQNVDKCIEWVKSQNGDNKNIILHYDECDYGSGHRQLLANIYNEFRDCLTIKYILYSATPEEVFFSGEVDFTDDRDEYDEIIDEIEEEGKVVYYNPPTEFCGPSNFLDANLVKNATPFFHIKNGKMELSIQSKDIINRMTEGIEKGSKRNIIMLRLSASDISRSEASKKDNKEIYQFAKKWKEIPELAEAVIYADKDEKDIPDADDIIKTNIQYSNPQFWKGITTSCPVFIVYDQTSSRSTEWKCHDRIFATHDYRNTINYSIVSQAQERVNHYIGYYKEFQPIEVYGHKKTFELSTGRISYAEYVIQDWQKKKLDTRIADRLELEGSYYKLIFKGHQSTEYPDPLPEEVCNRILQEKGCFAKINVSPRVNNTIKDTNEYNVHFEKCDKNTFAKISNTFKEKFPEFKEKYSMYNFKNPFIESEERGLADNKYKGYLRGWKVWEFKEVESQPGWGAKKKPRLTICYCEGILGVALRYSTGKTKRTGSLETHKSMYKK